MGIEGAIFVEDAKFTRRGGYLFVEAAGQAFCLPIPVFRRLFQDAAEIMATIDGAPTNVTPLKRAK